MSKRAEANNGLEIDVTRQTYEERWSEASIRTTVNQWDLNAREQQQLRELQTRLRDVHHWKNNPQEIVRYLRGPGLFEQGRTNIHSKWDRHSTLLL